MAKYPAKDVAAWLGNTVAVAMKHYAMQTEDAFRKAAAIDEPVGGKEDVTKSPLAPEMTKAPANGGCIGGCISGVDGAIERLAEKLQNAENPAKTGVYLVQDSAGHHYLMGDTGFEPPWKNTEKHGAKRRFRGRYRGCGPICGPKRRDRGDRQAA